MKIRTSAAFVAGLILVHNVTSAFRCYDIALLQVKSASNYADLTES
jgi:hypothetical protein